LKKIFTSIAAALTENETKIVTELAAVQGRSVEVGGYYMPDDAKASEVMRPSGTFNEILASI
jgi:isocitrate dehydrogenase